MAGVRPLALLAALLLCERAEAFGGLNYVRSQLTNATVFRPAGHQEEPTGWDQTKDSPLRATAVIGNTRVNIWK